MVVALACAVTLQILWTGVRGGFAFAVTLDMAVPRVHLPNRLGTSRSIPFKHDGNSLISVRRCVRTPAVGRRAETNPRTVTRLIHGCSSVDALLSVLEAEMKGPVFNHIHISAAFSRMAKVRSYSDKRAWSSPVLVSLIDVTRKQLEDGPLDARTCSSLFYSIATLHVYAPALKGILPLLVESVKFAAHDFDTQGLTNVIWGTAKLNTWDDGLRSMMSLLADVMVDTADSFEGRQLANIFWAGAVLRHQSPELLQALPAMAEVAEDRMMELNAQGIANTLWAVATLKESVPCLQQLLPSLALAVLGTVQSFNAQNIANSIWAIARLKGNATDLYKAYPALLKAAEREMPRMNHQGIANIMWAAATLRNDAPSVNEILPSLTARLAGVVRTMNKQDVANVIWSCGSLRLSSALSERILSMAVPRAQELLGTFTAQDVAMLCLGIGTCAIRDTAFLKSLVAHVRDKVSTWDRKGTQQALPVLAWALAKLSARSRVLLQTIAEHITPSLRRVNPWSLCALSWSYQELAAGEAFADFRERLRAEVERRHIPADMASTAYLTPEEWQRQT